MKLLKSGVILTLIITGTIAVLGSIGYGKDNSNKLLFESMVKEEECKENIGETICAQTLYIKNNGNKIPLMSGYVVKEKVFVPKYVEKEKIIVEEKKSNGEEKSSPADRIQDSNVNVFASSVRIDIKNAKSRKFIDSNSMDPLIDGGTTTIEIKPKNENEIKVGDIIAYKVKGYDYDFVHRVVEISSDEEGVYFIAKGDNFYKKDSNKIRFKDIEGIVVGVLY